MRATVLRVTMASANVTQRVDLCEQDIAGLTKELEGMHQSLRGGMIEQRVGTEASMRGLRG